MGASRQLQPSPHFAVAGKPAVSEDWRRAGRGLLTGKN